MLASREMSMREGLILDWEVVESWLFLLPGMPRWK